MNIVKCIEMSTDMKCAIKEQSIIIIIHLASLYCSIFPPSAPPTPPADRVVRLVSSTGTTMSVSFDSSIFSDVYGPVTRYALLVAQSSAGKSNIPFSDNYLN